MTIITIVHGQNTFTVSSKSSLMNGLRSVASDSFTKHFCHDEDENGSAKTTSEKQIDQRIACGGEHGLDYQCNHRLMNS